MGIQSDLFMGFDICPRCGKAHGANDFDCPEPSARPARPADDLARPMPLRPSESFRSEATPVTRLQPGALVGEYQIADRIAEGGMGTVYSAIHPIIGKKVAIKVLSGRLAKNNNAIRRFVLEARAVNDIRHPGLVDIFSFGRLTDGRPYYVMEFLDGRSLGAVLRAHFRLLPIDCYHVFLEVGRVLVAVHQHGIVHRDLKPDNVILIPQGIDQPPKVKLVDFGLAKLLVSESNLAAGGPHTAVGVNVGTPHYMAPEQCRGGSVDARSDLYALGVTFYETVTGQLPIDGPTPLDIWQAHVEVMPRRPELVVPEIVTPDLGALIMKLLAKRPDQRPKDAADFCQALEALFQAGRLGRPTTPAPDELRTTPSGLARVLSTTPVSMELEVRLASAAPEPPAGAKPAFPGAAKVPKLPQRQAGTNRPLDPVLRAEMATTFKEIPAFEDEYQNPEKRSQEIAGLREVLGLHIEEPAAGANDPFQVSDMVVSLERGGSVDGMKAAPTPGPSPSVLRRLSRPVEERPHLPRPLAPIQKANKPAQAQPGRARVSSPLGRILWVLTALAIAAGSAAVLWFMR
jgi:serine/threonine protein kinase